ncbi:MAG: MarR family transcriptional regulator, partial [Acidimicrobiia bacterium]|nr:MarR family transcriptional regulator [Acidimicrobiia bacterium]
MDAQAGVSTAGRLDDQLCFALYAATNAVTRLYRPLLKAIGLTYPQYLVLL